MRQKGASYIVWIILVERERRREGGGERDVANVYMGRYGSGINPVYQ